MELMKRKRDFYFFLFAIIFTATFTFIANPQNLSMIYDWVSEYLYYRLPFLLIAIVIVVLSLRQLWKEMKKIDDVEKKKEKRKDAVFTALAKKLGVTEDDINDVLKDEDDGIYQ